MRELPLGERSTAIAAYSGSEGSRLLLLTTRRSFGLRHELLQTALDPLQSLLDIARKKRTRRCGGQAWVVPPPVQTDLLGLVDRAHEQSNLNGQELDIREVDLDVAGNHQPFVQNAVEDLDQPMTARWRNEICQAGTLRRRVTRPMLA